MALTIGELTGYVTLDDRGFGTTLTRAAGDLGRFQSTVSTGTARIESTFEQAFAEVARAIGEGIDPAEAAADTQRLVDAIAQALDGLDDHARTAGRDSGTALVDGLRADLASAGGIGRDAGKEVADGLTSATAGAGREAGTALVDGLESSLDGAGAAGRKAGQDAAEGVRQGGQGGMGGVAGALAGALRAGPWAAAGAAIGAAVVDSMRTAIEREQIFTELAVKVGAFGQESERLGKIAGDLYAQGYGESLGEVTEALARVMQNIDGAGKASDEALGNMVKQALTVSRTMGEDVGGVTRAVGQILRTDLAPSAEEAFNTLIRGQQEGVNKSEDLLDTFNEYSTHFRDFGLSAQEALGLMQQGLQGGARDADMVADALKELDLKVKDKSAAEALKALGLNADQAMKALAKGGPAGRKALDQILDGLRKVEDPAKRTEIALGLFGTKAEDMARAVDSLDLDTAAQGVGKFENAVKQADKAFQDTSVTRVEQWKRGWEDIWAWLGDQLNQQLMSWFPTPEMMEKDWQALTSWFTETVPNFFSNLWTDVSNKTSEIWNGIGDWLSEKANAIVEWLKAVPTKVGEFFSTGWEKIKTVAGTAWEAIKTAISQKADAIVNWLKEAPGKIGGFLATGWDSIRSTASEKWEAVKSAISEKVDAAITWLKEFPGKVKQIFSDAGQWLVQTGRDLIQGLINGIKEWAGKAVQAAKDTVNSAIQGAKQALGIASPSQVARDEIGAPIMQGVTEGILLVEPEVVKVASSAILKAVDAAKKPVAPDAPGTKPAGYGIVEGAVKGIKEKEKDLTGQITATITKTMGTAEKAAKSGKSTKPAGYAVVEGAVKGVKEKEKDLLASIEKVIASAVSEAKKGAEKVKAELDKAVKPAAPGAPPASAPKPDPVLRSDLDLVRAGPGTVSPSGGVTVNIANASVREEADLSRIGSQVAYMVMARG